MLHSDIRIKKNSIVVIPVLGKTSILSFLQKTAKIDTWSTGLTNLGTSDSNKQVKKI